jgi:N-acetyl-1-D-myo-inositol-2-amino-2-deoxy-alpha-D-glucopyranoside deacetylase
VHELAAAMTALGVREHHFLGVGDPGEPGLSPRTYADSGMAYGPDGAVVPTPTSRPGAFALADPEEAAERLASVVCRLRPHVVVTYEPGGGYGHPDHVQAHRVTMRALELAAADWNVPKVFWCVVPRSRLATTFSGGPVDAGTAPPSMVVDDALVTAEISAPDLVPAKAAALRAHASQITVKGDSFALSNDLDQALLGTEWYRLAGTAPATPVTRRTSEGGWEHDLLSGLDVGGRLDPPA